MYSLNKLVRYSSLSFSITSTDILDNSNMIQHKILTLYWKPQKKYKTCLMRSRIGSFSSLWWNKTFLSKIQTLFNGLDSKE